MATFLYPQQQVTIPGAATEATLLLVEQNTQDTVDELQDVNSELNSQTTELQALNAKDFATETTLSAAAADIALIEAKDFATETTLSNLNSKVTAVDTDNVTVVSSVLPTGAATETSLAAAAADLALIEAKDFATETTLSAIAADISTIETEISEVNAKLAASFFTLPYDALVVASKTADGPTQILSKTGGIAGTTVQTLVIAYDVDGDFESAAVS